MKFRFLAAMAFVAFLVAAPILAFADTAATTTVSVPAGQWVSDMAAFAGPLVAALALWMIRKLPAQVASLLMSMRVDQLLNKAIAYAVNSVRDATHDSPLTVDVGNAVLAEAVQYAINHGPSGLINWMGGEAMIREKILARLNLDAKAAVQ